MPSSLRHCSRANLNGSRLKSRCCRVRLALRLPNPCLGEVLAYEAFSRCFAASYHLRAGIRADSGVRVFNPPGARAERIHSSGRSDDADDELRAVFTANGRGQGRLGRVHGNLQAAPGKKFQCRNLAERTGVQRGSGTPVLSRSEEHTSELQSPDHLVCRLLLEKKKKIITTTNSSVIHSC